MDSDQQNLTLALCLAVQTPSSRVTVAEQVEAAQAYYNFLNGASK